MGSPDLSLVAVGGATWYSSAVHCWTSMQTRFDVSVGAWTSYSSAVQVRVFKQTLERGSWSESMEVGLTRRV